MSVPGDGLTGMAQTAKIKQPRVGQRLAAIDGATVEAPPSLSRSLPPCKPPSRRHTATLRGTAPPIRTLGAGPSLEEVAALPYSIGAPGFPSAARIRPGTQPGPVWFDCGPRDGDEDLYILFTPRPEGDGFFYDLVAPRGPPDCFWSPLAL